MSMTTLRKVYGMVKEQSDDCSDALISTKDIVFDNLHSVRIGSETHSLRQTAQQLIASRLGIPIQYLRKCPAEVQAYNMNHWIRKEKNDELFFRFSGDEVRAIFTPRYRPVDNLEILERLMSFDFSPDNKVQCYLDDEFMVLSLPDEEKEFKVYSDTMYPGISVSNSEVGLASLSLSVFVLRLVCTNGMISKTEVSASYRHVSSKILESLPETMENIVISLDQQKSQIKLSIESKVDNPPSTMDRFNRQFQLSKKETEAVLWAWPFEEGDTMFHVVNAYTRASQFNGLSAEQSFNLQKVGGTILGMLN